MSNSIHASAVWRGHALGFNELAVSGSGPEIDMASGSGFRMLVASFPIDMVNEAAASLQYQIDLDDKTSRSVAIGQSVAVDVRNTWSGLLERAADGQDHPSAPDCLACECEELLRHLLLACALRPGNAAKVAERSERRRVVARALAAISDDPGEPMSIAALCRTTGASERTLHYAFKEHFNVSPARFLKLHRLHGAFRDLRRLGDAHSKTSDVANEWGFWHLGQFAKDFRDLFGELPSETYRRTLSQAGMLHHEGAQD